MNPTTLRRISAVLLFLAGTASVALPFISATALALSIGVIAAVAGTTQLLRIGQAEGGKGKLFRALSGAAAGHDQARGLVLADGLVTAILGGMLVAEWPSDSLWAVGTLFGISLFFSGLRLLSGPEGSEA